MGVTFCLEWYPIIISIAGRLFSHNSITAVFQRRRWEHVLWVYALYLDMVDWYRLRCPHKAYWNVSRTNYPEKVARVRCTISYDTKLHRYLVCYLSCKQMRFKRLFQISPMGWPLSSVTSLISLSSLYISLYITWSSIHLRKARVCLLWPNYAEWEFHRPAQVHNCSLRDLPPSLDWLWSITVGCGSIRRWQSSRRLQIGLFPF